jgi:NosR/NirI family nitrous oxide reductase transcriptional regulator
MRLFLAISLLFLPSLTHAAERFPAPEFRSAYQIPPTITSRGRAAFMSGLDVALLAIALGLAAYLVFKKRSRRGVFFLMLGSLLYFGFYRKGCICPIGSIQNVAYSATPHGYALPISVAAFFVLPLLAAFFFGRVFCSAVCPLGAIQDLVLFKPVEVPGWLESALGLFAYMYLGLAVLFAGVGTDFIICRYDPFVGFFRLSGPAHMLITGGVLLVMSMFVGRTYCRFICPFSVLLRMISVISKRKVAITPNRCIDCRLCEKSCPFNAILHPTPKNPIRTKTSGRRQFGIALALMPAMLLLFAILGYVSGPGLARFDFTVRLAQRISLEERHLVTDVADESKAWRGTGESIERLYGRAGFIQHRFSVGGIFFGLWMGSVLSFKYLALLLRRNRADYTTHPGSCLACARCYQSCPVDLESKGLISAIPQTQEALVTA